MIEALGIIYLAVALYSLGAMLAGRPFSDLIADEPLVRTHLLAIGIVLLLAVCWPLAYLVIFTAATRPS